MRLMPVKESRARHEFLEDYGNISLDALYHVQTLLRCYRPQDEVNFLQVAYGEYDGPEDAIGGMQHHDYEIPDFMIKKWYEEQT